MKKYVLDLRVVSVEQIHARYVLIKLTDDQKLPEMLPGQFVEVRVDGSPTTFLRRPISINYVDHEKNELWLLVATIGDGTRQLAKLQPGDLLNCILPLGNGFTATEGHRGAWPFCALKTEGTKGPGPSVPLLIGGGVGVAPLLYLGAEMAKNGIKPTFLLGARTKNDLLMLEEFKKYGRVFITTEDGSAGEKGFVTNHSLLQQEHFDHIYTCGPTPMMKAVARYAKQTNIDCEVSLENMMACGLGACLCCVEKTVDGNLCVCKDGPVFNINQLLWQI